MKEDDFVATLDKAGIRILSGTFRLAGAVFRIHEDCVTKVGSGYLDRQNFETFIALNQSQLKDLKV